MPNMDEIVMVECCGTIKEYTREEALKEYKYAMNNSQGETRERYRDIFLQLIQGKRSCTDMFAWRQQD